MPHQECEMLADAGMPFEISGDVGTQSADIGEPAGVNGGIIACQLSLVPLRKLLASIGETEKAITIHLERARRGAYVDQGQLWLPAMRDLRLDPRFAEIAEAVNLVSYWRQVEWPDKCGPTDGENWACFN